VTEVAPSLTALRKVLAAGSWGRRRPLGEPSSPTPRTTGRPWPSPISSGASDGSGFGFGPTRASPGRRTLCSLPYL